MKKIFLLLSIVGVQMVKSQVRTVSLQASGLTCSMCSNAINKALKKLDFVLDVAPDMKTYIFEITFKPNALVDFDLIRKKVEGAGFSVSAFYANIHFDNIMVSTGKTITMQDKTFLCVNAGDLLWNGDKRVKILDKGFVSAKEYKINSYPALPEKTFHISL